MLILLFGNLSPLSNVYQLLAVLDENLINITPFLYLLFYYISAVEMSGASLILSPL